MKLTISNGYAGEQTSNGAEVWVLENGVKHPLKKAGNHGFGFNWGYAGSGPADLAWSILAHATDNDALAQKLHQQFKFDYIAKMEQDKTFELDRHVVEVWLKQHLPFPEHEVTGMAWAFDENHERRGVVCTTIGNFKYEYSIEGFNMSEEEYREQLKDDWSEHITDKGGFLFVPYDGEVTPM